MNETERLKEAMYEFTLSMLLAGHSFTETLLAGGRILDTEAAQAHTDLENGDA